MKTVALIVPVAIFGFWVGHYYGYEAAATQYRDLRVLTVTAESLGLTPAIHDAAARHLDIIQGVVALGIASERWPRVGTEGDAAVVRIDRETGRVLAKCQ